MYYIKIYPPLFNSTYVKATTYYSTSYYPHFAVNPSLSLIGGDANTTWVSTDSSLPQKFNIDYGSGFVFRSLYVENYHSNGGSTTYGLKNISVYGTNSSTAFDNLDGADITDLTLLGSFLIAEHVTANIVHPQYFNFENSTAFRYIVIRILDRIASVTRIGIKRIEMRVGAEELDVFIYEEENVEPLPLIVPKFVLHNAHYNYYVALNVWFKNLIKGFTYEPSVYAGITAMPDFSIISEDRTIKHIKSSYKGYNPSMVSDLGGSISGIVMVEGDIWSGALVRLYYRPDGQQVDNTYTNNLGEFRFDNLEFENDLFTVIAFKDNYNAIVFDKVIPTGVDPIVIPIPDRPPASAIWDINLINSELWLSIKILNTIIQNAEGVVTWIDHSGKGRNAEQTISGRFPSFSENLGITFDQSGEYLRIISPYTLTQTIFIVLESLDDTFVLLGSENQGWFGLTGQLSETSYAIHGNFGSPTFRLNGSPVTWTTRDQVSRALRYNLSVLVMENVVLNSWGNLYIAFYSDYYLGYSFQGNIKEVVVLDSAVATEYNKLTTEGCLAWKHNLVSKLPSTHYFKSQIPLNFITVLPPALNDSYVISTTKHSSNQYQTWFSFNTTHSLIGDMAYTSWITDNLSLPQKINIDYGQQFIPKRIYIENLHHSGSIDYGGINGVSIYGSNSVMAFNNLDGNNTTDLTLLSTISVLKHVQVNKSDPQFYHFTNNTTPFRYIILILTSLHAPQTWFGVRRIELQKVEGIEPYIALDTIIDHFDTNLSVTGSGLKVTCNTGGTLWLTGQTLKYVSSGKYYWEVVIGSPTGVNRFGIGGSFIDTFTSNGLGGANNFGYYGYDGSVWYNNVKVATNTTFTSGDIIGVAVNMDTGKVFFSKNGGWFGNPVTDTGPSVTGVSGNLHPAVCLFDATTNVNLVFKSSDFNYAAPSGYSPF